MSNCTPQRKSFMDRAIVRESNGVIDCPTKLFNRFSNHSGSMVQTWKLPDEMPAADIFILKYAKITIFLIFNSNFQSFLVLKPKTDDIHEFYALNKTHEQRLKFFSHIRLVMTQNINTIAFSKFILNLALWRKRIFNFCPRGTELHRIDGCFVLNVRNDSKFRLKITKNRDFDVF